MPLHCRLHGVTIPTPTACASSAHRAHRPVLPSTLTDTNRRALHQGRARSGCFRRLVVRSSKDGITPWSTPGYKGAAVSQLPEAAQAGVLAGVFAALGVATTASCTLLGPAVASTVPGLYAFSESTWPLIGLTYVAAGVAHFGVEQGFLDMYPHRGAWGIWYLPGSPSFHVRWTGVAEVAGGAGLLLGALHLPLLPEWLESASALGLFALSWAVYPANIYMFTHNAPGPVPEGQELPIINWQGHLVRGVLQVFLLSILWGIAHPMQQ